MEDEGYRKEYPAFRFLEHTADIKFETYGDSLEEAFCNAAYALKDVMTEDELDTQRRFPIEVEARDYKGLLYDFLSEILFLVDEQDVIISEIKSMIINTTESGIYGLKATLQGGSLEHHDIRTHIKAVTYSDMCIEQVQMPYQKDVRIWHCVVVVDV